MPTSEMAVTFFIDSEFPLLDMCRIAEAVHQSGIWIPGYIPPSIGSLDLSHIRFTQDVEGYEIVALLDRNLVSRLAKIAREGVPSLKNRDEPTDLAMKVMTFCQCMNIHIEPSIAFHELAQHQGNERALEELAWFRVADRGGRAHEWIEIEAGRRDRLSDVMPEPADDHDLAKPLRRWRRNYVALLKIAELELRPKLKPRERAAELIDWMWEDYFMAGPAAMIAMVCFSPRRPGGLLKQLKSPSRERAISGIRNAAWDATYLSEFVRRVKLQGERQRFVLVTADKALASIAPALWPDVEEEDHLAAEMTKALETWWPAEDAAALAQLLSDRLLAADDRPIPHGPDDVKDPVGRWTEDGERSILAWRPP